MKLVSKGTRRLGFIHTNSQNVNSLLSGNGIDANVRVREPIVRDWNGWRLCGFTIGLGAVSAAASVLSGCDLVLDCLVLDGVDLF